MDKSDIIYLNHAGTSWPKPQSVLQAAARVAQVSPAEWPDLFQSAHRTVADYFHVDQSRLLLTPSCTSALNLAVMDHVWNPGDRILSSRYEHHALDRAFVKLNEVGVQVTRLPQSNDHLLDLAALETELKAGGVRLVALTAACNVTGLLLPISETIDLAHEYGALVLIDGAQIAGWWDLDLVQLGADMFTFAGHKGPQAPWGIGGLYVSPDVSMNCPGASCELSDTRTATGCAVMPGYCDAGSVNLAALAGMAAGCLWLGEADQSDRLQIARSLADKFADAVRPFPEVAIQHDLPADRKMPTVAIRLEQASSIELATTLRQKGVICSGGLQCAPQAHLALGTDRTGVIRFSFGPTNQYSEIAQAVEVLKQLTAR